MCQPLKVGSLFLEIEEAMVEVLVSLADQLLVQKTHQVLETLHLGLGFEVVLDVDDIICHLSESVGLCVAEGFVSGHVRVSVQVAKRLGAWSDHGAFGGCSFSELLGLFFLEFLDDNIS